MTVRHVDQIHEEWLLQRLLVHRSHEGECSHIYGRGGGWQFETSPYCHLRLNQSHDCKTAFVEANSCNKDGGRRFAFTETDLTFHLV